MGDYMKPIIGIIARNNVSNSGHKIGIYYDDIVSSVIKSGGIAIIISNKYINEYIKICNGFILQGGDDIDYLNNKIIKMLYDKNIPLLGICLGMQEMSNGVIKRINGHNNHKLHEIEITRDSLLYKILGVKKTMVNSRHKYSINETNFDISGICNGVIEAIEDKDKKFFMGLQWHPESMYNSDINSRKIFDYFIKMCHN